MSLRKTNEVLSETVGELAEVIKAGQYFVVVDISVPGGKMIGRKIYHGVKEADKVAAKMNKQGKNVQVIDAMWYKPARNIMKKTGMIGESFRGRIGYARVPIGIHRIKITPDEPGGIQFVVNSVKLRKGKLKVVKKTSKYVIVSGEAGDLSSIVNSFRNVQFDGKVEDV